MPWGKLDDNYSDHPKTLEAWARHPRAVGLHALAISWSMRHGTEGHIPEYWLQMKMPDAGERAAVVDALVQCGLFDQNGSGVVVHDFLDWNPSNADVEARREADRQRKRERRSGG